MSREKKQDRKKNKPGPRRSKRKSTVANRIVTSSVLVTPALERLRLEKVTLVHLDVLERQKQLIPRDMIFECLGQLSLILKNTGEKLQKHHGNDARAILEEGLEEYETYLQEITNEVE